ncbi:TcpJ (plasmid) [Clostridium baratii]
MRKKTFLGIILFSFMAMFMLVGCGDDTKKLDIDNCLSISYEGYDGTGVYSGRVSISKLTEIPVLQRLTDSMFKGDYKVVLKADKERDLKNGDKIKLTLDYNEELYKRDFGVKLILKNPEIEVSGLNKFIDEKDDLTTEEWAKLTEKINNELNEVMEKYEYSDNKLICKVIQSSKDNSSNAIDYWYEVKNKNGAIVYINIGPTNGNNTLLSNTNIFAVDNTGVEFIRDHLDGIDNFDKFLEEYYKEKDKKYVVVE